MATSTENQQKYYKTGFCKKSGNVRNPCPLPVSNQMQNNCNNLKFYLLFFIQLFLSRHVFVWVWNSYHICWFVGSPMRTYDFQHSHAHTHTHTHTHTRGQASVNALTMKSPLIGLTAQRTNDILFGFSATLQINVNGSTTNVTVLTTFRLWNLSFGKRFWHYSIPPHPAQATRCQQQRSKPPPPPLPPPPSLPKPLQQQKHCPLTADVLSS